MKYSISTGLAPMLLAAGASAFTPAPVVGVWQGPKTYDPVCLPMTAQNARIFGPDCSAILDLIRSARSDRIGDIKNENIRPLYLNERAEVNFVHGSCKLSICHKRGFTEASNTNKNPVLVAFDDISSVCAGALIEKSKDGFTVPGAVMISPDVTVSLLEASMVPGSTDSPHAPMFTNGLYPTVAPNTGTHRPHPTGTAHHSGQVIYHTGTEYHSGQVIYHTGTGYPPLPVISDPVSLFYPRTASPSDPVISDPVSRFHPGTGYHSGEHHTGTAYHSGPHPTGTADHSGPHHGSGTAYHSGPHHTGSGTAYHSGPNHTGSGTAYHSGPHHTGSGTAYHSGPHHTGSGTAYHSGSHHTASGTAYHSGANRSDAQYRTETRYNTSYRQQHTTFQTATRAGTSYNPRSTAYYGY